MPNNDTFVCPRLHLLCVVSLLLPALSRGFLSRISTAPNGAHKRKQRTPVRTHRPENQLGSKGKLPSHWSTGRAHTNRSITLMTIEPIFTPKPPPDLGGPSRCFPGCLRRGRTWLHRWNRRERTWKARRMRGSKIPRSHLGVDSPNGESLRRLSMNQKGLVPLWGTTLFVALVTASLRRHASSSRHAK